MKALNFLIVTISVLGLFSCEKPEGVNIDQRLIIGTWRLEEVTFNGIDGKDINDWISNSTVLDIGEHGRYYRNYDRGTWSLDKDKLILDSSYDDVSSLTREYRILKLTDDILKVQITLTEGQYCCDFEEFESEELLTITETFVKEPE